MKRTIFDEDHEAFRDSCRTFVDRNLRPNQEKHAAEHGFGRQMWLELGKQGLLGLNIPEEYGGSSVGDPRFSMILAEELSKLSFAYSSCVGIHADCVAPYLVDLCTEEQKQRWLPKFCTGELITAIAMTEPSGGSDLAALKTHCRPRRRRLGAQRLQDLHHQRLLLRPRPGRRPDQPRQGREGHHLVRGRGRHARVRARPQARQGRPAGGRHVRAVLRRRPAERRPGRRPAGSRSSST